MKVKQVKIDEISIGERFREDHGDIESLVSSIQEKGVLQPITVDGRLNLLAGERRIKASVEAGLTKIPAVIREIGEDVIEAKEIELYENIHRKDFT
jgi:ParB family chromosome partitioning protein